MSTFKVGDEVRCISTNVSRLVIGQEYTVIEIGPALGDRDLLSLSGGYPEDQWYADRFEKVEDENVVAIDKLKEDVIKYARQLVDPEGESGMNCLEDAVIALDAALAPDPWELLKQDKSFCCEENHPGNATDMAAKIEAALVWKQDQS